VHHANVYAYMNSGFGICNQLKGHPDQYYNNSVVITRDGNYGDGAQCTTTASADATVVHDNVVFTPTGAVTECGMSLAAWQAASPANDPGTVARAWPADAELLGLIRAALDL
jgi:hypothetical protein